MQRKVATAEEKTVDNMVQVLEGLSDGGVVSDRTSRWWREAMLSGLGVGESGGGSTAGVIGTVAALIGAGVLLDRLRSRKVRVRR